MNDDTITSLLSEIRDNQRQALDHQRAQLDIARSHFEQAKAQIAESLQLQREAVSRARFATRVALPAIFLCIAAVLYLIWPYL